MKIVPTTTQTRAGQPTPVRGDAGTDDGRGSGDRREVMAEEDVLGRRDEVAPVLPRVRGRLDLLVVRKDTAAYPPRVEAIREHEARENEDAGEGRHPKRLVSPAGPRSAVSALRSPARLATTERMTEGASRCRVGRMSLDDTGRSIWQQRKPPLAMLIAGSTCEMLSADLGESIQTPLRALSTALSAWWPRRVRDASSICEQEYQACLTAMDEQGSKLVSLRRAVDVQMAAVLRAVPSSLPAGDYYNLSEDDFLVVLRDAAKVGRLPVAQLESRLKHLKERQKERWPDLVARAGRMHWGRSAAWGKLDKRVRTLAALADLGAHASWTEVGGKQALRLELDDMKRIAMLSAEELEALRTVIPSISAQP